MAEILNTIIVLLDPEEMLEIQNQHEYAANNLISDVDEPDDESPDIQGET